MRRFAGRMIVDQLETLQSQYSGERRLNVGHFFRDSTHLARRERGPRPTLRIVSILKVDGFAKRAAKLLPTAFADDDDLMKMRIVGDLKEKTQTPCGGDGVSGIAGPTGGAPIATTLRVREVRQWSRHDGIPERLGDIPVRLQCAHLADHSRRGTRRSLMPESGPWGSACRRGRAPVLRMSPCSSNLEFRSNSCGCHTAVT